MPETTETNGVKTAVPSKTEIVPRGDMIDRIASLVRDETQARIIGVTDPMTGAESLLAVTRDGDGNQEFKAIPASVFDDYLPNPRFRRGRAVMTSLDSFIAHVERFKDADTVIFASDDRTKPSLTAVLDYSPGGLIDNDPEKGPTGFPRFHRHRTHFDFPLSDEWKAWQAMNKTPMSLGDFAAFLEDRIPDVLHPGELPLSEEAQKFIDLIGGADRVATPVDLITLSKGLKINEEVRVVNAQNLSSGEAEISFQSEHTDEAGVKLMIPTSFQVGIPVFRNGPAYGVIARLRYRRQSGTVVFFYELWRTDRIFDHAFTESVEKVESETALPVLLGAPEV